MFLKNSTKKLLLAFLTTTLVISSHARRTVTAVNLTSQPVSVALVRTVFTLGSRRHTKLYTEAKNQNNNNEILVYVIPPGEAAEIRNYPYTFLAYDRDITASPSLSELAHALKSGTLSGPTISHYDVGVTKGIVYILPEAGGKLRLSSSIPRSQKDVRARLRSSSTRKGNAVAVHPLNSLDNQAVQAASSIEYTKYPSATPAVTSATSFDAFIQTLSAIKTDKEFKKWANLNKGGLQTLTEKLTLMGITKEQRPQEWNLAIRQYISVVRHLLQQRVDEIITQQKRVIETLSQSSNTYLSDFNAYIKTLWPTLNQLQDYMRELISTDIVELSPENPPYGLTENHVKALWQEWQTQANRLAKHWKGAWDLFVTAHTNYLTQTKPDTTTLQNIQKSISEMRTQWGQAIKETHAKFVANVYKPVISSITTTATEAFEKLEHTFRSKDKEEPTGWSEALRSAQLQPSTQIIMIDGVTIDKDRPVSFLAALKALGLTHEEIVIVKEAHTSGAQEQREAWNIIQRAFHKKSAKIYPEKGEDTQSFRTLKGILRAFQYWLKQ